MASGAHRPLTAAAAATMVLAPVDCSFEGTFRGNKFHGTGTWHGPKGENVYEGEWHFNQKDGKGVLTSPINGDTFCTIVGQLKSAALRAAHPAPLHPAATSALVSCTQILLYHVILAVAAHWSWCRHLQR